MKYKIRMIILLFVMVIGSAIFYYIDDGTGKTRIHQHLSTTQKTNTASTETFSTALPIMAMDTNGKEVPGSPVNGVVEEKKTTISATIQMYDNEEVYNTLDDTPKKTGQAQIAYRGNSSRYFDKKPYKIKFTDDEMSVFGMSKDNDWVLNGPFLDRTLIRNYLCYNIAGEIMEYAPNCRYIELFVNGEYQGVYLAVESIEQSKNRVNIQKSDEDNDITSYIVCMDRAHKADDLVNNFTYYTRQLGISAFDIVYPGVNKLTEGKLKFIEDDISKIEKIIYSYDLNYQEATGYEAYLDKEAFAEYFIINEFFSNVDAGRFSTYYYKDVKGKLKPVVWDFNNACDNYIDYQYGAKGFSLTDAPWFDELLKDEKFVDAIVNTYHTLRKHELNEDYLMKYIDDTKTFLGDAVNRNYEKWGYIFSLDNYDTHNYLAPVERNLTNYDESIGQLKGWIKARGDWLDENIETLYQNCKDSKTKNTLLR